MPRRAKKEKTVASAPKRNDDGLSTVLLVLYLFMGFVIYLEVILCVGVGQMMVRSRNAEAQNISAPASAISEQQSADDSYTEDQTPEEAVPEDTIATPTAATPDNETQIPETVPPEEANTTETQGQYVGSIESEIYHIPTCSYVDSINQENIVWYTSLEEAVQNGKGPCTRCG